MALVRRPELPIFKSSKQEIQPQTVLKTLADWKDFTTLLCLGLIILGVAALTAAAQYVVIVKGKVTGTGTAVIDGGSTLTRTVTVIIENDDRVYRIKRGTAVEYAISDRDASLIQIGLEVELKISSYSNKARLVRVAD